MEVYICCGRFVLRKWMLCEINFETWREICAISFVWTWLNPAVCVLLWSEWLTSRRRRCVCVRSGLSNGKKEDYTQVQVTKPCVLVRFKVHLHKVCFRWWERVGQYLAGQRICPVSRWMCRVLCNWRPDPCVTSTTRSVRIRLCWCQTHVWQWSNWLQFSIRGSTDWFQICGHATEICAFEFDSLW